MTIKEPYYTDLPVANFYEEQPISNYGSFSGQVIDNKTGAPVSYATIQIVSTAGKFENLPATVADKDGYFKLTGNGIAPPNAIQFSAAEYNTLLWQLEFNEEIDAIVSLERKIKELPEVIIPSTKKKNDYTWLLLVAGAAVIANKKKKVGEVGLNMNTLLLVGAGVVMFKGFNILNDILSFFGLSKTKDEKQTEAEEENPQSPLGPGLYNAAPQSVKDKLYNDWMASGKFQQKAKTLIIDAFGAFGDDEALAKSVFTSMPSQVVSSYFAYMWEDEGIGKLITWLRGDTWPADRLSSAEINDITNYLKKLPKGY